MSEYSEVKGVLLKAAGETAIKYGNQLFDATSETFKGMTASSIVEWMQRTVKGTCQGCKSLDEGVLAIAMALTRRVLPQSGKMFLENRVVKNWGDYHEEMPGVSCIVPFSLTNGEESEAYRCAIQEYVAGECDNECHDKEHG